MQRQTSVHRHFDVTANLLRRQLLNVAPEAMLPPERDRVPFANSVMDDQAVSNVVAELSYSTDRKGLSVWRLR